MRCRRTLFSLAGIFLLCPFACSRREQTGLRVIAVLPFDNLTDQPGLDWLSAAGPSLVARDLAPAADVSAQTAANRNEAEGEHAGSYLYVRCTLESGKLAVYADLENAERNRLQSSWRFTEATGPAGALDAVNRIAGALDSRADRIALSDPRALPLFGQALLTSDLAARASLLTEALQIDPGFAPAWFTRIEDAARQGGAAAGLDVATRARAALSGAGSIDRARLNYVAATLAGDAPGRLTALEALATLTPSDAQVLAQLGQTQQQARDFRGAAATYGRLARLEPWNGDVFNQLGYSRAWAHDEAGAVEALRQYQALLPQANANGLDSLGEVEYFFGDYAAAERDFLSAHQRNPALFAGVDLLKAAQARLMTGDSNGADTIFQRYLAYRRQSGDPLAPVRAAQWTFLLGKRRDAMNTLATALPNLTRDARALAETQYGFWLFASGDNASAAAHLQQGGRTDDPAVRNQAGMALVLFASKTSGALWKAPAQVAADPAAIALEGYALALSGKPSEAIPALERALAATSPGADGQLRAVLLGALVAAGRSAEGGNIAWPMPIPLSGSEHDVFAALVFPRWLALWPQAVHDGDRVYNQYRGDLPLFFEPSK